MVPRDGPCCPSPPGGRTLLVCQGLDTVADLWLDGEPLGRSENMFRPAIFDVTGRLESPAELLVCFRSPLAGLTPPAAATGELIAPSGKITSVTVPLASDGGIAEVLSRISSVRVEGAELCSTSGTIWWACAPSPWIAAVIRKVDGSSLCPQWGPDR